MSSFHDVRVVRGRRIRIVLDNGRLEEISESHFHGAAIRALEGSGWGFVTTEDMEGIPEGIRTAKEVARKINRSEDLSLAKGAAPESAHIDVAPKVDPSSLSLEEKVALIREIENRARIDGISSTQAVYTELESSTQYSTSDGIDVEQSLTRTAFAISAVAKRNGLYQAGSESRAGVCGLELFEIHDAHSLAENAAKTAIALLDARVPKGGTNPVVLDQELAGVFVHEAVGHATEGDIVLEGGSILEGRLGERIGSELITVKDDPSLSNYGYYPFDDEGSASSETVLVEDGILRSYLHSRETAGRLGGVPRNARSQGYARPVVRMSNTYIDNGDWSFSEIIEELKDGVYLLGSRGGQVNTAEGVFQFNAKRGYLVEGGEITQLLRDVSLSGHTLEILSEVAAVGDDLKFNSGRCGKAGQLVPVSDGSPHILVSKATVGGAG
ncbi:MAG: TldD/PmbA family protein [Methanotrichaceae archaeon]|nr:TldD/PmbA family protein [Methanotrichaceae archaeon]